MSSLSQLTQTRLTVLKSIEDTIDQHKRDCPESDVPNGSADALSFLLDFYEQVEGWEFSSVKRISERYNQSLRENAISRMSCDY